ncbi:unnamed protein product [Mytilus coruscus]|uniref:DUF3504 domain-containing protein n=1 Tax=Mytilus coruscus TaxID=42192 RepID=A0A6J8CI45_MYTCO|nr:unnamed protein product [Mytilus coruscus]
MEPCIRDTVLQYFLAEVKKTDGNDYPSASLYQLFVALQGQIRLRIHPPKDEVDAFYFKPLVNYTTDQWFCKVPVGHNILQKTVKRLCTAVGLEGKNKPQFKGVDSNKTISSKRRRNNLFVRQLVRHRSNAVRSYKRTANFQQNESSEILYDKKQKTTTCTETKLQSEEEKTSHDTSHQVVNIESVRRESVAEPTTLSFTFNIKL